MPTAIIKSRDLEITRPAGKQELYRRLMRAARAVCSPVGWPDKAQLTAQYETCIDQAMSGAVARFNRAEFSEYVAALTSNSADSGVRVAG